MIKLTQESQNLLDLIQKYDSLRPSEIRKILGISTKNTFKHLKKLRENGYITKVGETPSVYYKIKPKGDEWIVKDEDHADKVFLDENYIYVSPSGEIIRGITGFRTWCEKNNFEFRKEVQTYKKAIKKYSKYKKNNLISSKNTILSSKSKIFLNDIYFSDFYSLDYFGKTKLGQLVYVGKTSQNSDLVNEIVRNIKGSLLKLIASKSIQTICYIPPSVKRKVQFMDLLRNGLEIELNEIKAKKIPSQNIIPQKTLRRLEDRIQNAKDTIAVSPTQKIIGNVLIIDDATGSGATINETAGKIRKFTDKKIKIYGYSVVGSFKGFDIISEV